MKVMCFPSFQTEFRSKLEGYADNEWLSTTPYWSGLKAKVAFVYVNNTIQQIYAGLTLTKKLPLRWLLSKHPKL